MLKSELNRYVHDRRTRIFAILIIAIPILDFIQVLFSQDFIAFGDPKYRFNPIVASFLSGSQAEHYGQIIFVWFMPILLLGLCADRVIRDHKEQYDVTQIMRLGKKRYYLVGLMVNGIFAFVITGIGLVLNYLLALLVFHGGKDFLTDDLENTNMLTSELSWQYDHTVLTMLIVTIMTDLLATAFSLVCYVLSLMFVNYYVVYTVAFVIWFAQIISKYSTTYLMQPLIEYGLKYQVPSAVIFVAISGAIIGFGYWRMVIRHDDWL